ncbi:MAG TPA: hypothetical protein VE967_00075 [Gemmatimonadaceae bacterium]|nr:hypothetical protein [Gemmatimonadaceae bacterium]
MSLRSLSAAALSLAAILPAQTPPVRPAQAPAAARVPMMASVDSALFKGMKYRLVGPSRGGRVTTVTGVPSQPKTFYMGVASGGLFRTTDGGENWVPITDGKVPVASSGRVAVAESDPNIIYYGTGSDGVRSNVSTGRGIYKTTDGGKTWDFAGLYNAGQIGGLKIHPTNPNIVWVAAYGDIFKPSNDRGVYKSIDGGKTWKRTLYVSDSTGAMDVELMPGNPNVVYAWMSRIERKPWTIISGSREGGLYKSTDGGETWTHITAGLPNELIGKGNIAVTAANPQRVYALIEARPGGGLYRSDDAGQTWTAMPSPAQMIWRPFYYTALGADPTNADIVYGGAETFYKSADGGKTFTTLRTPHGDNHDIWISPKDGNTMIQANDGGANVSTDGGRTWSSQMNQPTSEIYGVWMDNEFPYKIYGAQQDASTVIISSVANPYNRDDWRGGPGCETGPIMPYPKDANIVYGSCKGQYEVMNMKTGMSRNYWVGAQSLYGNDAKNLILRFQRVSPMATSPHDPNVVYYGSQYLHRSRDKGVTWEKMSPDLTAHPACCQGGSGEPITRDVTGEEFFSTLYAITESPHTAGVIWTGSNDGPFYITRDNGKTWTNITPKDLPPMGRVAWIDASPHRPGSAYYAVYRYLVGDYQPYIYMTNDYGATWKRLTDGKNGIPADWPTRVVREDPDREGLLYAGTEFGMFISFDNGGHWQPFDLNLPKVPINDIRVYKKNLIVATQGRAIWQIDDITPLHQITPAATASGIKLFSPRDGYRTNVGAEYLSPLIEYYLPNSPSGAVRLDILDSASKPFNSYSSDAPVGGRGGGRGGRGGGGGGGGGGAGAGAGGGDAPDPEAGGGGGGRGRGNAIVSRVTKDAGMNRFVWDLRHSSGLTAPPGRYQAKLVVGDVVATVPFRVRIDPREAEDGTTEADLREQFLHNQKMQALTAEVNAVVTRATAAETRLRNATGAAADTLAKVHAISSKLTADRAIRYSQPGLRDHITYLAGMTSRGDQKVGRDAVERLAVLEKELAAVKAELDKLLGPDIKQNP